MIDQTTTEYLTDHEFFSELSEEVREYLSKNASVREIKKDQVLFRQGEHANKFYIVRNGQISIQIPAIMGPTLEIQTLGMNQVLGWSWLISPYRWSFQALAEVDTELLEFDGTVILAHCDQDSQFGYELFKKFTSLMAVRLDAARQKMMDEWNPAGFA